MRCCSVHPSYLESSIHWVLRLFLTKEDLVELYRIVVFYLDHTQFDHRPQDSLEYHTTNQFCQILHRVLCDELTDLEHYEASRKKSV